MQSSSYYQDGVLRAGYARSRLGMTVTRLRALFVAPSHHVRELGSHSGAALDRDAGKPQEPCTWALFPHR
jgi:hypothetical protein